MIVSPGSKGMVFPSSLNVGMAFGNFRWGASSVRQSVIALATDHVERSEGGDDVRQHAALDEPGKAARDLKTRGPNAHPIRRPRPVGHDVVAELAVAAFGVRVDLAL